MTMTRMPPITIVTPTWAPAGPRGEARAKAVQQAVKSWQRHIDYVGQLRLHIADDGSTLPGYGKVREGPPSSWYYGANTFSRQERHGEGASLNAGLKAAFEVSDLALILVDDWAITGALDLSPWASILLEYDQFGAIFLGQPLPWTSGNVECLTPGWILRLQRDAYALGCMRPALYHKRLFDALGPFKEDCDAYECDADLTTRWLAKGPASGLWTALALIHPWQHLGDDSQVGHDDPRKVP